MGNAISSELWRAGQPYPTTGLRSPFCLNQKTNNRRTALSPLWAAAGKGKSCSAVGFRCQQQVPDEHYPGPGAGVVSDGWLAVVGGAEILTAPQTGWSQTHACAPNICSCSGLTADRSSSLRQGESGPPVKQRGEANGECHEYAICPRRSVGWSDADFGAKRPAGSGGNLLERLRKRRWPGVVQYEPGCHPHLSQRFLG